MNLFCPLEHLSSIDFSNSEEITSLTFRIGHAIINGIILLYYNYNKNNNKFIYELDK